MKEQVLSSTIGFLQKYNSYSELDVKKLRYGLEGLYLTLTKLIVIFALGLILGIFKEVIIVIILFNIIRYFAFGFHAEKSYQCLIISIINFIGIPLIFLKVNITFSLSIIISIFCIINYLLFAPADTVKRPLKNKRKRLIRKVLTIVVALIYVAVMFILRNNYISSLIVSSLLITVVVINPITYKLLGQPYNNYKN